MIKRDIREERNIFFDDVISIEINYKWNIYYIKISEFIGYGE